MASVLDLLLPFVIKNHLPHRVAIGKSTRHDGFRVRSSPTSTTGAISALATVTWTVKSPSWHCLITALDWSKVLRLASWAERTPQRRLEKIKWIPRLGIVDESQDRAGIHLVSLLELGHGARPVPDFLTFIWALPMFEIIKPSRIRFKGKVSFPRLRSENSI